MQVNYMIATWSGNRFLRSAINHCLKSHLHHLNQVKHNLSQITIGYPHNPDDSDEYKDFMFSLKSLEDGTPIVVMPMINEGLSYGQWSRIFDHYRDQFSHYILIEDDYVPVQDNFDGIMADILYNSGKDFICGMCANKGDNFGHGSCKEPHSAISNGIATCETLEGVYGETGFYDPNARDAKHQISFSNRFINNGFKIGDYIHRYRCLYWPHRDLFRMYWDGKHEEDLIVPLQFLEQGKEWPFEKYLRKNGVMQSCVERPKKVDPSVKQDKTREKLRRDALTQRRVIGRRRPHTR